MLVDPKIDKEELIEILVRQVIDLNPEDTRESGNGQLLLHPGLVLELKRLKFRLEKMPVEEIRLAVLNERFEFCTE